MARIVDLHRGALLRLEATAGARVQVLFGAIWLTEPRRLDDVFAASGDEVVLDYGGQVLIEAQGFARVIVSAPKPRTTFANPDQATYAVCERKSHLYRLADTRGCGI